MMMVFLALPALQRAQRDTQRTDDVSRLITQLNQYQSNNRGKLPQTISTTDSNSLYVTANEDYHLDNAPTSPSDTNNNTAWKTFYNDYLAPGNDTFEDPSGGPYNLIIQNCSANNASDNATGSGTTNSNGCNVANLSDFDDQAYTMHIYLNANCNNDLPAFTKGSRKVAVVYKKEGGGRICQTL